MGLSSKIKTDFSEPMRTSRSLTELLVLSFLETTWSPKKLLSGSSRRTISIAYPLSPIVYTCMSKSLEHSSRSLR